MGFQQGSLDLAFASKTLAMGGGLEGAERINRETVKWSPPIISPDQQINPVKDLADARTRDSVQNDGYGQGIINTFKDSIVGDKFRLNAQPEYRVLGFDEAWAEEFQEVTEARFNLLAGAQENWFDASGKCDLTGLVRLAVVMQAIFGEVLGTNEWLTNDPMRPFKSAFQAVSPTRLTNPNGQSDSRFLRRGVRIDRFGKAKSYFIRASHPSEIYMNSGPDVWREVQAQYPWGRKKVLHLLEPMLPSQTRGISDLVAALKTMRMTKQFEEVTLQNAVIQASYAAAIESELPSDLIYQSLGAGQPGFTEILTNYLGALNVYVKSAGKSIEIDGAKIPHLFPGTKLAMQSLGTPGGVGTGFHEALLRHIAAALGCSYEEFSKDFTKTNYSSARASMAATARTMASKKKLVADGTANFIYAAWMEEELHAGNLPLPAGVKPTIFNDPVKRAALTQASWIGAARYQIDELKETQSSVLRMNNNMSTLERECAALGLDWRQVLAQKAREKRLAEKLGVDISSDAARPGANMRKNIMTDSNDTTEKEEESDAEN